jgi:chaperonin GroES
MAKSYTENGDNDIRKYSVSELIEMFKNLCPIEDRLVVLPSEDESNSTIYIPDSAKEKPVQGVVLCVGEGCKNADGKLISLSVKPGDVVVYGKWAGTEYKHEYKDGKECKVLIMKASDLLMRIEK